MNNRRDFICLCVALGWSTVCGGRAFADEIKKALSHENSYAGPLTKKVVALLERVSRYEMTGEEAVIELKKMFDDVDLKKEFESFVADTKKTGGAFHDVFKAETTAGSLTMSLYWVPAHETVPPHGHHNLLSTQVVLSGSLQCRQYERLNKIDDRHLTLSLNRETVLNQGDCIQMAEDKDNVHWFGAVKEPALLFDTRVTYKPLRMFDSKSELIGKRDFVDPTLGSTAGGDILARNISRDEAYEKFAKRPVFS